MSAPAQRIQTAAEFFESLSERYGQIEDYTADITIKSEEQISLGILSYQRPNRIRIDFEEPPGQILVSDGEVLQVYIPHFNVVLQQRLRRRSDESLAALASEQGLDLLERNYSIAYLDTPDLVPLDSPRDDADSDDEESAEDQPEQDEPEQDLPEGTLMVTKLKLDWKTNREGYRQLILSVTEDLFIRRIIGITLNYEEIQFDFEDVQTNQGIPETRFEYDAPASANLFNNFLFEGEG